MRSAESCLLVLESVSAATDLDLISYLRSIPDELTRRGVRCLSWYLLLVATIGFLVPLLLPRDGCDGKTVGRSIVPATGCGSAFIAQVTLYSAVLGVAISLAWGLGMEPSGFEPLTPCMPCSLFIGVK